MPHVRANFGIGPLDAGVADDLAVALMVGRDQAAKAFAVGELELIAERRELALQLRQCGDKWNRKLAAYEKGLPKLKKYLAYYNKWDGYPAQRPPRSPVPLLTRESYRACLYECLGDTTVVCPGGWPAETDKN